MARALYFGCLDGGHYLHSDTERWNRSIDPQQDYPGIPWDAGPMDAGLLLNSKVPDNVQCTTPVGLGGRPTLWYAFYWWDRTGDSRPNSNSGFYVRGFALKGEEEAFEFACKAWPDVVQRQAYPLVLDAR